MPSFIDPLQPLSVEEIEESVQILRDQKKLDDHYRFITIELHEPHDRSNDMNWTGKQISQQTIPRQSFLVIIHDITGVCWEAVVCLSSKTVISLLSIPNVQPAYTPEDYQTCEKLCKSSPELLEALKKRGVESTNDLMVDLWASGRYCNRVYCIDISRGFIGENDDPSKRIAKPILYLRDESDNVSFGYGRPIEGLTPIVDLNMRKIIAVEDLGIKPIPETAAETMKKTNTGTVHSKAVPPLKPLEIIQKDGPSFVMEGHRISWQGWNFRIGFNPREGLHSILAAECSGLTIHTVQIYDRSQNRYRKVFFRGSLSEMVVPYGDPRPPTYRRNAFDVGEEGLGFNANSLELGCDCVGHIQYLNGVVNSTDGKAHVIKNAICIHEEDAGVLWKHTDWRSGKANLARSRRLVVSSFATVANYDYGFFWYFYQDGTIHYEVKLTGLLLTTGEYLETKSSQVQHGTLLKPGLSAPYHTHIFSIRIEPCIDGANNSVFEVNCEADSNVNNVQGNAFIKKKQLLAREFDAQRTVHAESGRFWEIANRNVTNALGNSVAYRLVPAENSFPFLHPQSPVAQRAGFAAKHFWVTQFHPKEKYSASMYPNKPNFQGEGLPQYSSGNREIVDKPLTVWYTMAVLHIPRLEEWPIMSVTTAGFSLLPDGFFNSNPSVHLRQHNKSESSCNVPQSKL